MPIDAVKTWMDFFRNHKADRMIKASIRELTIATHKTHVYEPFAKLANRVIALSMIRASGDRPATDLFFIRNDPVSVHGTTDILRPDGVAVSEARLMELRRDPNRTKMRTQCRLTKSRALRPRNCKVRKISLGSTSTYGLSGSSQALVAALRIFWPAPKRASFQIFALITP
ncbi:hypothetical protein PLICRDRAFT_336724 [Plicaturopsis crispa FD-325 SS-3]|uniref:Uncharacterized protein n=1 Tax=Plicaturopsis crispa FD-325 SS-3 TaxID=944288 RepID=A0A0C9T7F5_PLICR|nr:hypothetical protein PLICRDRAFT_336724 [Plicaturopsis crispa FD-325 SS-3]